MAELPLLFIEGDAKLAKRQKTNPQEDIRSQNAFLHNLCPTDYADVFTLNGGQLTTERMRFGLIPSWAKETKTEVIKKFRLTFNARSETIFDLASFRSPIRKRRCLIPVQGWHEWPDQTTPYFIHQVDNAPLMFAGIWDSWESPYSEDYESGSVITSMSVVTTPPGSYLGKFHDRCPLILEGDEAITWMSDGLTPDDVRALIRPYESMRLEAYRVAPASVVPKNKSQDALHPISLPVPQEVTEPLKAELDKTPELKLF